MVSRVVNDNADIFTNEDDLFLINESNNETIVGGEDNEVWGDTIYVDTDDDLNVIYDGNEQGSINDTHFSEIETVILGSGDDTVELLTETSGTVNGGKGYDTLVLPDGSEYEVTITSSTVKGDTTSYTGFVTFEDGTKLTFKNFEEIVCFVAGTPIDTIVGKVSVENLKPGDLVLTRDNGYQPLVWVGSQNLSLAESIMAQPIRIEAGALGKGLPSQDLRVSPRHRVLLASVAAELMFGEREVLVAAEDLVDLIPGVTQEPPSATQYVHIMFDKHQIVRSAGAWTESFQPTDTVVNSLDQRTKDELLTLFPELYNMTYHSARQVLTTNETQVLLSYKINSK